MFAWFWREPEPLASIGIEVISAEIVLGATTPAGAEKTQGEQREERILATDPEQVDPQREAEQKATEQAQNVQVAREETAPEQTTTLERQADERQPDDNAAAPREETRAGRAEIFARDGREPEHPRHGDRDAEGSPARHDRDLAPAAARGEAGRERARAEAGAGRAPEAREGRRQGQGTPPHRGADARRSRYGRPRPPPTPRRPRAASASAAPATTPIIAGSSPPTSRATSSIRPMRAPAATAAPRR